MISDVNDRHTDRRKLVTLTLAAKGIDLDQYVTERRRQGDSWVILSTRLHDEFGIDVPQGTLHRWFRNELVDAA